MSLGVGGIVSVGGGVGGSGSGGSGIITINPGTNIGPTVEFQGVNGVIVTAGGTNVVLIDGAGASGVSGGSGGGSGVACFTAAFTSTTSGQFVHNLNTRNLVVQVIDDSSPPNQIVPDRIVYDTLDVFSVLFNTPRTGRVVAVGCEVTGTGGSADGSGINAVNGDTGPNIDLIGVSGINIVPQGNGQIFISGEGVVGTGGGGACFSEEFTDQTTVTVTHSLGTQNVIVQVQDENRDIIIPDNVRAIDSNNVQVDFNSQRSGHIFVQACSTGSSGLGKFAQDFTDTTNVVVTHGLGSLDVIVQVRDDASPALWMLPDKILFNAVNSLTLQFNSNRSGRVIVMG